MNVRRMSLHSGWYPQSAESAEAFIKSRPLKRGSAIAAVAPHAGWFFSGGTSLEALSSLKEDAGTVIVAGGHLDASSPVLFMEEDAVQTPFGILPACRELRAEVKKALAEKLPALKTGSDRYIDNTVEVQLPFVHYLFPQAEVLCFRAPQNSLSYETGRLIAESAAKLKKNAVFVASTDLTHYGQNYGWSPEGTGKSALQWVKETNDRRFIEAVLSLRPEIVLERAEKEKSACSCGAVLAALGFAGVKTGGKVKAELLSYTTSADVLAECGEKETDSFVGYAAIKFSSE